MDSTLAIDALREDGGQRKSRERSTAAVIGEIVQAAERMSGADKLTAAGSERSVMLPESIGDGRTPKEIAQREGKKGETKCLWYAQHNILTMP